MTTERRIATAVGLLFVAATVASVLGSLTLGSTLDGPGFLAEVAAQEPRVVTAALLFLVAATSAFATAWLLFPVLARHDEALAAGYVGLRAFENVFYVVGVVALLTMVTVGQDGGAEATGVALRALHDWAVLVGTLVFFSLGSLALNVVLYRSRLVPRWLATWGLVGAPLALAYGVLGILGVDTAMGSPFMLLAMPIAFQEMTFAGWLLVRGFQHPPASLDVHARLRVEVTT
jgi:hypothetical protein